MSNKIYKDNVGDSYLIPEEYLKFIVTLDNLVSDTATTRLYAPLVDAWEYIMEPYRF